MSKMTMQIVDLALAFGGLFVLVEAGCNAYVAAGVIVVISLWNYYYGGERVVQILHGRP